MRPPPVPGAAREAVRSFAVAEVHAEQAAWVRLEPRAVKQVWALAAAAVPDEPRAEVAVRDGPRVVAAVRLSEAEAAPRASLVQVAVAEVAEVVRRRR